MDTAVDIFNNPGKYPRLNILQHVIIRAIRHLPKVEALALIRGSYQTEDGGFCSLGEAQEIYAMIMEDIKI